MLDSLLSEIFGKGFKLGQRVLYCFKAYVVSYPEMAWPAESLTRNYQDIIL